MKPLVRFGKRIPVPPSVQIRRELRMFCAQEDIRERCAEAEGMSIDSSWQQICDHRASLAAEI
jgi:hypothetical protein